MKLTQFFAFLSSDVFVEKKKKKKKKRKAKWLMIRGLGAYPCRKNWSKDTLFEISFSGLLIRVGRKKRFTEVSLNMENTSRPENVSRSVFLLKLSVTSGLLNLPQAACKTCNIWKNYKYIWFSQEKVVQCCSSHWSTMILKWNHLSLRNDAVIYEIDCKAAIAYHNRHHILRTRISFDHLALNCCDWLIIITAISIGYDSSPD